MNCHKIDSSGLIISIALMVSTIFGAKAIYAETANNIDATIKISVCGDSTVEYPENCEGQHLDSQTCNSLGYSGGNLDCDIACTFDTTNCIYTPSPTASPTATPVPTSSSGTSNSNSNAIITSTSNVNTNTITSLFKTFIDKLNLPALIISLDPSQDNKIESSEIVTIATSWVKSWSDFISKGTEVEKCDINSDDSCDLSDFSVLLYYVDR